MLKPTVVVALLLAVGLTGCSSAVAPKGPTPTSARTTAPPTAPTAAADQTPAPLAVLCTDAAGDGASADILTALINQTATTVTVTVKFAKPVPNDIGITTFFNNADGNGGGIFQALWTNGLPAVTTQDNADARVSTVSTAPVVSDGGTTISTTFPATLVNPLQGGWVWKVTSSTEAGDADSCSVPAA